MAVQVGACSLVYPSVQVAPTFRVRVEDRGRPVEGLRVAAGKTFAVTDKNGLATFSDMRSGSYLLSAAHDAGIADGINLEVRLDGPTNITVPLKWPSNRPISVRHLKGTIRGPDYLPGHSQPRLSLDLLEGPSGRRLKGAQTNDKGEFDFESAAQGLYFLSLKPSGLIGWSGEQVTGLIVVAVNRTAVSENLDIDLWWTSCGLQYTDQSKCLREFQTELLSGRVVDSAGATIPGAKVLVLNVAGDVVDQLQSDREGGFASSRPLAGTYGMVISMAGFAPFRAMAHVGPPGHPARPALLTVQLGLAGSCSSLDPR